MKVSTVALGTFPPSSVEIDTLEHAVHVDDGGKNDATDVVTGKEVQLHRMISTDDDDNSTRAMTESLSRAMDRSWM